MPEQLEVPLAEAIQALRREIAEANRLSAQEDLRFRVGPIEASSSGLRCRASKAAKRA